MRRFASLAVVVLLSACAGVWQPPAQSTSESPLGVTADTPADWHRIEGAPNNAIVLTKNGISIEAITVSRSSLDQKLPNSPKRWQNGMSPEAAADVDISNHEFAPGIDGFEVLDRGTVTIDGHACYHYSYTYLESFGQPRNVKDYGCIIAPYVYRFHFSAPAQKWFPELLPTFDALVASAKFG